MRRDVPELWLWWIVTCAGALMGGLCGIVVAVYLVTEDLGDVGGSLIEDVVTAARVAVFLGLPIGALAGLAIGFVAGGLAALAVACLPRRAPVVPGTALVTAVVLGLVLAPCAALDSDGPAVAGLVGWFGVGPLALAILLVLRDRTERVGA